MNVNSSTPSIEASAPALQLSPASSAGSQTIKDPAKLATAARQFESLLIGEMLKSAREGSSDGWLGSGDDASSESAMGMAEGQFAQALANAGGFGLAHMIEQSVSRQESSRK